RGHRSPGEVHVSHSIPFPASLPRKPHVRPLIAFGGSVHRKTAWGAGPKPPEAALVAHRHPERSPNMTTETAEPSFGSELYKTDVFAMDPCRIAGEVHDAMAWEACMILGQLGYPDALKIPTHNEPGGPPRPSNVEVQMKEAVIFAQ